MRAFPAEPHTHVPVPDPHLHATLFTHRDARRRAVQAACVQRRLAKLVLHIDPGPARQKHLEDLCLVVPAPASREYGLLLSIVNSSAPPPPFLYDGVMRR